jgi:hypothetical protein
MADIGTSAGRRAGFAGQRIVATLLGLQDAIDGAEAETRNSGLPGPNGGGPGNAYKHLLVTGELYRRLGPTAGPRIAELREWANDAFGQSDDDADMDRINNAIVVNERPHFETWDDVVLWARAKMVESAAYDGDGQDRRASWYEKQPSGWRPDFSGLPIAPIEKGGAEHRYRPRPGMAEPMGMSDASRATGKSAPMPQGGPRNALNRSVASWSQDDMRAPAYRNPQHPRHDEAQRMVRQWFEQSVGPGSAPIDATGRMVAEGAAPGPTRTRASTKGGGPVPVRAHGRDGGKVQVQEHCRGKPA